MSIPAIYDILIDQQENPQSLINLRPTISWKYSDLDNNPQLTYQVRIGSIDSGFGFDAFVGDIWDSGVITDNASLLRVPAADGITVQYLLRNVQYYVQIKVQNATDESAWGTAVFKINSLPQASSVSIYPTTVYSGSLMRTSYNFNDEDGDTEDGTRIRWFKNAVLQTDFNDYAAVEPENLDVDDKWYFEVTPKDGLEFGPLVKSNEVTIANRAPTAVNAVIVPSFPRVSDKLKASYLYTDEDGDDEIGSEIRWYKNTQLQPQLNDNKEVSPDLLSVDDQWYFTVRPSDGVDFGVTATSNTVTVTSIKSEVTRVLVENQKEPIGIENRIDPVISWDFVGNTTVQQTYRINVGTTPFGDDIWDSGTVESTNQYAEYGGDTLEEGAIYYVSVKVFDGYEESDYKTLKFTTVGSVWQSSVENETGWTIECRMKVTSGLISNPVDDELDEKAEKSGATTEESETTDTEDQEGTAEETTTEETTSEETTTATTTVSGASATTVVSGAYQRIEINDGAKMAVLRVSPIRLELITNQETLTSQVSGVSYSDFNLIRVIGRRDNIQVFVDGILRIDGNGKFTDPTGTRKIEFGDAAYTASETSGEWDFIRYSILGAYEPASSETFIFENIQHFPHETATSMLSVDGKMFVGTNHENLSISSRVFEYDDTKVSRTDETVPLTSQGVNALTVDVRNDKWLGTQNGLSQLRFGKPFPWTQTTRMDEDDLAENFEVKKNTENDPFSISDETLTIDTSSETLNSHAYYEQGGPQSAWFNVSNQTGWTIETEVFITYVSNRVSAPGIYISDGSRYEVINCFQNKISLQNAKLSGDINLAAGFNRLRITGKQDTILVYVKREGVDEDWLLIVDGTNSFNTPAVSSGNARNIKIIEDTRGSLHAVFAYRDRVLKRTDVYHAIRTDGIWGSPSVVSEGDFDSESPDIAADRTETVHIVWHDNQYGNYEIVHRAFSQTEYSSVTRVTNATGDSQYPSIDTDSENNVHLVWQDNRDDDETFEIYYAMYDADAVDKGDVIEGKWISSGLDDRDLRLTADIGNSRFPRIAVNNEDDMWAVWQDNRDNVEKIFGARYESTGNKWYSSNQIGNSDTTIVSGLGDSQHPALDACTITSDRQDFHLTWDDDRTGNVEIFYARYNATTETWISSGQGSTDTQITLARDDSTFPSIVADQGNNLYISWQDDRGVKTYPSIFVAQYDFQQDQWRSSNHGYLDSEFKSSFGMDVNPSVLIDKAGNFQLVWTASRNASVFMPYHVEIVTTTQTAHSVTQVDNKTIGPERVVSVPSTAMISENTGFADGTSFVDSGYYLKEGQKVVVTASGEITIRDDLGNLIDGIEPDGIEADFVKVSEEDALLLFPLYDFSNSAAVGYKNETDTQTSLLADSPTDFASEGNTSVITSNGLKSPDNIVEEVAEDGGDGGVAMFKFIVAEELDNIESLKFTAYRRLSSPAGNAKADFWIWNDTANEWIYLGTLGEFEATADEGLPSQIEKFESKVFEGLFGLAIQQFVSSSKEVFIRSVSSDGTNDSDNNKNLELDYVALTVGKVGSDKLGAAQPALPLANIGSLIGKFNNLAPFEIGLGPYEYTAPANGTLHYGINTNLFSGNVGAFTVRTRLTVDSLPNSPQDSLTSLPDISTYDEDITLFGRFDDDNDEFNVANVFGADLAIGESQTIFVSGSSAPVSGAGLGDGTLVVSGVTLISGQTVKIYAEGKMSLGENMPEVGPNGFGTWGDGVRGPSGHSLPLPNVSYGSLVARFNELDPFFVGTGPYEFTAPAAGVLKFSINDDVYNDNTGEFSALVVMSGAYVTSDLSVQLTSFDKAFDLDADDKFLTYPGRLLGKQTGSLGFKMQPYTSSAAPANDVYYAYAQDSDTLTGLSFIEDTSGNLVGSFEKTQLLLWSKTESDTSIEDPEIGLDGLVHGDPTYVPSVFDNGVKFFDNGQAVQYDNRMVDTAKGAVEFYYTPDLGAWTLITDSFNLQQIEIPYPDGVVDPTTAFTPIGFGGNTYDYIVYSGPDAPPVVNGLVLAPTHDTDIDPYIRHTMFYVQGKDHDDYIHLYYQRTMTENQIFGEYKFGDTRRYVSYTPTFVSGTALHFGFAWDESASMGGTDTLRIYEDNVLQDSTTDTLTSFDAGTIMFGNEPDFFYPSMGVLDNIKIHAIAETDFSGYATEDDHTTPETLAVILSGSDYSWGAGDDVHLRLVWDGSLSSNNLLIYVNGIVYPQVISGTTSKFMVSSYGETGFFANRDETGSYAGMNAVTHEFMLRDKVSVGTHIFPALSSLKSSSFQSLLKEYPEPTLKFGDLSDSNKTTSQWRLFKIFLRDAFSPLQITNYYAQDDEDFILPDAEDASLSDNFINDLIYDEVADSLWIATNNGVSKYDIANSIWTNFTTARGITERIVTSIVMDKNGYVWAGTKSGVFQINGFDDSKEAKFAPVDLNTPTGDTREFNGETVNNYMTSNNITRLGILESNTLAVGTDAGFGLIRMDDLSQPTSIEEYNVKHGFTDNYTTAFGEREVGQYIIGTKKGFNFFDRKRVVQFTKQDGLPSERITDIDTIDNIVYVSTNAGILRMVGTQFRVFTSNDGLLNNNITSLISDANDYLWVGTHGGLTQFKVNDTLGNIAIPYTAEDGIASNSEISDYKEYLVLTEPIAIEDKNIFISANTNDILDETEYEVVINESDRSDFVPLIRFEEAKKPSDIVSANIFEDWREIIDFNDELADKQVAGEDLVRITDMKKVPIKIGEDTDNRMFISAETNIGGVVYEVEDNPVGYPSDEIVMDRTAPEGTIEIGEYLGGNLGRVEITATDNVTGVEGMIVSNFPNFTSDGQTPQEYEKYKENIIHEFDPLASALSATYTVESGEPSSGAVYNGELYVGTKDPGMVYKFDTTLAVFALEFTTALGGLPVSDAVLDMEVFDDKLFVSVSGTNRVFFYDGELWQQAFAFAHPITSLSTTENLLYMGSDGDGVIYSYNGEEVNLEVDTQETTVHDIVTYKGNVFAATAPNGRIYRFNGDIWEIIYADNDANILSLGIYNANPPAVDSETSEAPAAEAATEEQNTDELTLFAGTNPNGKVLKYIDAEETFERVFHSVPESVRRFRTLDQDFYAIADDTLFLYNGSNWIAQANNTTDINDLLLFNQSLFMMNDANITVYNPDNTERCVFLKLKDRIGNITDVHNPDGTVKDQYQDCIDDQEILDSLTFKNQILEVDSSNKIVQTFKGEDAFLSADTIRREVGTYESDIFDGGSDLISWLELTWLATLPENTEITVEFRVAETSAAILDEEWIPITSDLRPGEYYDYSSNFSYDYSYGYGYTYGYDYSYLVSHAYVADLSFVNDPFIQFRYKLISKELNVTPVLHEFTLTARKAQSVHFYTSNFTLPEDITRGLLTANTDTPVNTEVVFGINTEDSTLFENYYVVEPNRIFELPAELQNKDLRIGIKLISSPQSISVVDEFALIFELANNTLTRLNLNLT